MAHEHCFKPYGCVISNALFNIIDTILLHNETQSTEGEFNAHICDLIVSFLPIPISVIIEHGSYQTMVTLTSLTSYHAVSHKFPSVIGDTQPLMVGHEAIDKLSPLSLIHPVTNGIISKYSLFQMNEIWNYIFNHLLLLKSSHHSALIILPPQTMSNIPICDEMMGLLFGVYNVPALAIMDKASLSCHYYCYSTAHHCKKNGIVVDLGHDICTITPVFNFRSDLQHMVATKLFSAKSLEQYICTTLKENKYPSEIAHGLKEIENIKKNYIKIAESRADYEYILGNSMYDGIEYVSTDNKLRCWIADWILCDIGEYIFNPYPYEISFPHYIDVNNWLEPKCALSLKRFTINQNDKYSYLYTKKKKKKRYDENGESETDTDEEEKENKNKLHGLPQIILDAIMKYEDVEKRQNLLNNVVVTGGMSSIEGLGNRLHSELVDLVMNQPSVLIKDYVEGEDVQMDYEAVCAWITVVVGERRSECNSICASILTSMPCSASMWLLRDEYLKDISQNTQT